MAAITQPIFDDRAIQSSERAGTVATPRRHVGPDVLVYLWLTACIVAAIGFLAVAMQPQAPMFGAAVVSPATQRITDNLHVIADHEVRVIVARAPRQR